MIEIDGSYGEGGGQIVRTACALAAVTGNELRIFNIRRKRKNPGLRTQHMTGLMKLNDLCDGYLKGGSVGSQEILFKPVMIRAGIINVEISTAGSLPLVLQTLLLPSFYSTAGVNIRMRGGATDTHFSPTMDYTKYIFLNHLSRMKLSVSLKIDKRGFYPAGGAIVDVSVTPGKPAGFNCHERGEFLKVIIISGASEHLREAKVAERQADAAENILSKGLGKAVIQKRTEYYSTICPGSQISIIGKYENTTLGADGLGRRGKRAEAVGEEAAGRFLKEHDSGACVDRYACDQILPYLALAGGSSIFTTSELSPHSSTGIWVIRKFIDREYRVKHDKKVTVVEVE